jgi:hypothetical protein
VLQRITARMNNITGRDLKNTNCHYITIFISWFLAISVEWD